MATVKKPRKPSLKKGPKKPKASSSLEVHKRYESRAKAVEAENAKRLAAYNKDLKTWESVQKQKQKIREKY